MGRVKQNFLKMKRCLLSALAVGLCLSVNVMAQVPSYVPTNGLVGWWPFNGNANDASGNGNNGTVNGATLTADRNGNANKAYSFDGVDDDIVVPNSNNLNFSSQFSISAWFAIDTYTIDSPLHLIMKGTQNYAIKTAIPNRFSFGKQNIQDIALTDPGTYDTAVWVNLIIVYNYPTAEIYINNQLSAVGSANGTFSANISSLTFGSYLSQLFSKTRIDDIGIWNRALTQQEITALYNSCQGTSITSQPSNSTVTVGSSAQFSANAAVGSTYQWQSNPLNTGWLNLSNNSTYLGATTSTLTVTNASVSNHNQPFRAIVNSGGCIDTSNIATIQITDTCITNLTVYDTLLTTVTDTLIINTTLSLPAPNNENTILIYPNPASDHITIDNGNYTAMAGYTIKIENNAGQQVFQSVINQQQFYVDLSTWSGNGLYFVHLIDAQGNTVTVRKIVLQ